MNRPTLIPGLPRAWRSPSDLQLGTDPARAVLLHLPDPRAAKLLDLLDGTRPERVVLVRAGELGIPPADARALLDALEAAGLVLPAASLLPATVPEHSRHRLLGEAAALALRSLSTRTGGSGSGRPSGISTRPADSSRDEPPPIHMLRRRAAAHVLITGRGRLGAPIAVALAEAGVGHVRPDLPGAVGPGQLAGGPLHQADVGRPQREAVTAAILQAAPDTDTQGSRRAPATLVIQLDHDQPVSLLAAAHAAHRRPHLAVTIREGAAVIGPLVPPAGAPCLNCLDLHRRDRDAGWPDAAPRRDPGLPEPCAVTTILAATAFCAAEVLTYVDGGSPQTLGATIEISTPPRARRRTWPPHPSCPCTRTRR
jgi:hypothetical protein